jgi:phosphopantetheinyl transferase
MIWHEQTLSLDRFNSEDYSGTEADWLSQPELEYLAKIQSHAYRERWLGGRWLAKQTLLKIIAEEEISLNQIHIESRNEHDQGTRPKVFIKGKLTSCSLSISHSDKMIFTAASIDRNIRIGADVIDLTRTTKELSKYWFTPTEIAWCEISKMEYAELILWSVKEALYKATHCGESFYPHQIEVVKETPLETLKDIPFNNQNRFSRSWDNLTLHMHQQKSCITNLIMQNQLTTV